MATSPPTSPAPAGVRQRPMSMLPGMRPNRSSSRMSVSSRRDAGSRFSDEDGKTAVKVGEYTPSSALLPGNRRSTRVAQAIANTSFPFAAVRVRPPLNSSDPGYDLVPQRFRGSTCQVTSPTSLTIESSQGKKLFVFDRVFAPDVDQEGVYAYLNESVNSFMEGYNVSILAYGQSGAGKSYTMGTTGPAEQNDVHIMGMYMHPCVRAKLVFLTRLRDVVVKLASSDANYSTQALSLVLLPHSLTSCKVANLASSLPHDIPCHKVSQQCHHSREAGRKIGR
jgi:hypothetical protein